MLKEVVKIKEMILFFVDDILEIVYNGKVITRELKDAISHGMITNKEKFAFEFVEIMKKEKVKSKLFGGSVTVVKEPFYHPSYLFYLEHILEDIGFVKIHYINIEDLFSKNDVYVEVNNSYMVINIDSGIFIDLTVFKDIPKIIDLFSSLNGKNILLFGKNKNIPSIKLDNSQVYYLENYTNYISQSLLKAKKYDA